MQDARSISDPTIAEEVNVSAATIRNCIQQLGEHGIIIGFHASIDFERVDGNLTNLFIISSTVPDREKVAKRALQLPGLTNIRAI